MYRLCWIPRGWSNPWRGVPHSMKFDSLEQLKNTMSKCLYNGEWVEDEKGNRIELDWVEICNSK